MFRPDPAPLYAWLAAAADGGSEVSIGTFLAIYLASALLALPASWFQGAASFLYGPAVGIPLAWAASTVFGAVTFELSRGRMREWVRRRLGTGARFVALDRASTDRGGRLVLLLRLSPMAPYNAVSYLLGLTGVTRGQFLRGTALGTVVPVLLWGTIGAQLTDLAALASGEATGPAWAQLTMVGVTVAASLGVVLFVRAALKAEASAGEDVPRLP